MVYSIGAFCDAVSSTLIQIPGCGNILLDVGEGTMGQLARRFGPWRSQYPDVEESADDILSNIKLLFISHIHADHHSGLAGFLRRRLQVCSVYLHL